MNRIILIGNGFDKAHNLPTGYRDFMDWYWIEFGKNLHENTLPYEDQFVKLEHIQQFSGMVPIQSKFSRTGFDSPMQMIYTKSREITEFIKPDFRINTYKDIEQLISKIYEYYDEEFKITFKNEFWKHISEKSCLETWLDIENEYYNILKSYLKVENRNALVKKLNTEFCQVKDLLETYLTEVCKQKVTKIDSIQNAFVSPIRPEEIACLKKKIYMDCLEKESHDCFEYKEKPNKILILNFNYTKTVDRYKVIESKVIDIHGELKNKNNPIIFGYGDELDDDYKEIEKTNDNDFLDNIKSIHYHNTDNYRRLLEFLQDESYQVFVAGHSCGNSDRTLLNTIFEHENCISIKPFYHQWKDEKTGGIKDNYTELVKNISRNFNDKQKMRDIVVRKEFCTPLVSY